MRSNKARTYSIKRMEDGRMLITVGTPGFFGGNYDFSTYILPQEQFDSIFAKEGIGK